MNEIQILQIAATMLSVCAVVLLMLMGAWRNKAAMYRALWIETGRRWEAVRAERDEWISTAALNAEVINTQRQSIAKLKQEVTELYSSLNSGEQEAK